MAFAKRHLTFTFQLGQGDFGEEGSDTVTLKGLRATADITCSIGNTPSHGDLRIWGMPLDVMNKLTVLNVTAYPELRLNKVIVEAGDDKSGMGVCFDGNILEAWVDGGDPPDMAFTVSASTGLFEDKKPIPPTSYDGSVDAAVLLSSLARQKGMGFENHGVIGHLSNPYLPGTVDSQIQAACAALDCEYSTDKNILAVWPRGGSRTGAAIRISPDTGMVGYPSFTEQGCRFRTIYNPNLVFGSIVDVTSQLSAANGQWIVANVAHNLDAEAPGGQWFSEVDCTILGHILPIIPPR